MIEVILVFFLLFLALGLVLKFLQFAFRAVKFILMSVLGVALAPALGPAYILERMTALLRLRVVVAVSLGLLATGVAISWGFFDTEPPLDSYTPPHLDPYTFDTLKFLLPALLLLGALITRLGQRSVEAASEPLELFYKKRTEYYVVYFSVFGLLAISAFILPSFSQLGWPEQVAWYAGIVYWTFGVLGPIYLISQNLGRKSLVAALEQRLDSIGQLNEEDYLAHVKKNSVLDGDEVDTLFQGVIAKRVATGEIVEMKLADITWLFGATWLDTRSQDLADELSADFKHTEENVVGRVAKRLGLSTPAARDYLNHALSLGDYFDFEDGRYFVSYRHAHRLNVCAGCGITEEVERRAKGEWYCSESCEKTEEICLEIHRKPISEFRSDAAASGFVLMAGADAWNEGHKVFAAGGQGHGLAAENANNRIDRALGRDAQVVGGDNAADGPDRIVDGELIQTKYCSTGARSVGSAFEGRGGNYRYIDESGNPMQLEVPRDQYEDAVRTMEKKIREGSVPGVGDPDEATNLVRKGSITYEQARNITKFGTMESIAYDASEGMVVGTVAGGINFGITALVYYMNTKDTKTALQVAAVQGGKTFAKTFTVYVAAQQLHRLEVVQGALNYINVSQMSPSVKNLLGKGLVVESTSGINKALRGTAVTSFTLVVVTTGPDIIRLVRGRMSRAQFTKNVAATTSGLAGGAVGSIAGGAMGAALGPVGALAGRAAGGMVGGMVASGLSNQIANNLMEDDQTAMLRMIEMQVEYWAVTFMLTEEEIDCLNTNLDQVITPQVLEVVYAAKGERRAMANFFVKPVVVSVVKQRPHLQYQTDDVISACDELVA